MKSIDTAEDVRELLTLITKRLVDNPDQVSVNVVSSQSTLIFEIAVEKPDLGKIIGKRGQTIGAIRTIMMSAAGKQRKRVYVEVKE